jgi:tetratricopeptide (TPR) repeat protein
MPLLRNPLFINRQSDLKALAKTLKGDERLAIGQLETAAATGLGGMGKTQLACEFVHRYGQFFAGGVFWLSFADPKAVPAEVAACGRRGNLELRPDFEERSLEEQVQLVMAAWQSPLPRLLIFDNCEDPELLAQWRPSSGGCRILITSRRADWDATLGVQALPLDVLSRRESIALLREHQPDADNEILDAIAKELGDLPLALHLAGSYMAHYRRTITPAQYLEQLRDPALLQHRSLKGLGFSPTGHVQNLYRTIALSYEPLDPTNEIDDWALKILAYAACLAPGEPIPYYLLMLTLNVAKDNFHFAFKAEDAVNRLVELGLLRSETDNMVRLHRLVVAFIRDVNRGEALATTEEAVETAVIEEASRINKAGYPAPLLAWQPHLRAVTDVALARADEQAASLCNELGWHLWDIAAYVAALPYFKQAVAIRERILGEDHADTAQSLHSLGYLLRAQGKLAEAGPYFKRALVIRDKILGEEHPDTIASINEMGRWLYEQGNLIAAQRCFERALALSKRVLGEEHPLTAEYYNNLGASFLSSGDLEAVQAHYARALAINEKILGPDHPNTALNLNNLGYVLRSLGKAAEAQAYHERALAIRQKIWGPDHPDIGRSLRNLGTVLQDQGDLDGGLACLEQALIIHEKSLGKEHPETAICLTYLGLLLQDKRDLDGAQRHLERALAIRQKVLKQDHPLTAESLVYLGQLLHRRGDLEESRSYLEQALAIQQKLSGDDHALTA